MDIILAISYDDMVQFYQFKKIVAKNAHCFGVFVHMNILEFENYQEKKNHFDASFPYNTYLCCIPQDFSSVPLHWHLEMEIIYIKKGCGIVSIDLASEPVKTGDIIFIAPGQLHGISQQEDSRMEYENIIFDLNMLESKIHDSCTLDFFAPLRHSHMLIQNIYTPMDAKYTKIAYWLDQADEICKTFPHACQLYIKSCLFGLFYELFRDQKIAAAPKKALTTLEKLKIIIKYVENHFQERITIKDMATYCDYSQSHFMKYFKNAMGMSFIECLNDYRLMMAARLLLASDSSVLSISQEVGFENLSYFNRSFKKKYHITPSAYRNTLLKNNEKGT